MPPTSGGRPRRMLVVAHGYPPRQVSGAELVTSRKVAWWRDRGHTVRVVAADPRAPGTFPFGRVDEEEDRVDGVEVLRLRFAAPDHTRGVDETYAHPLLAAALERQLATFRPNLLYQVSGHLLGIGPLVA